MTGIKCRITPEGKLFVNLVALPLLSRYRYLAREYKLADQRLLLRSSLRKQHHGTVKMRRTGPSDRRNRLQKRRPSKTFTVSMTTMCLPAPSDLKISAVQVSWGEKAQASQASADSALSRTTASAIFITQPPERERRQEAKLQRRPTAPDFRVSKRRDKPTARIVIFDWWRGSRTRRKCGRILTERMQRGLVDQEDRLEARLRRGDAKETTPPGGDCQLRGLPMYGRICVDVYGGPVPRQCEMKWDNSTTPHQERLPSFDTPVKMNSGLKVNESFVEVQAALRNPSPKKTNQGDTVYRGPTNISTNF